MYRGEGKNIGLFIIDRLIANQRYQYLQGFGYKSNRIHRIVKKFCVQGGDITTGDGRGGRSIYKGTPHGDLWGKFKDEAFYPHSKAGLLSMANSGKNTNR